MREARGCSMPTQRSRTSGDTSSVLRSARLKEMMKTASKKMLVSTKRTQQRQRARDLGRRRVRTRGGAPSGAEEGAAASSLDSFCSSLDHAALLSSFSTMSITSLARRRRTCVHMGRGRGEWGGRVAKAVFETCVFTTTFQHGDGREWWRWSGRGDYWRR